MQFLSVFASLTCFSLLSSANSIKQTCTTRLKKKIPTGVYCGQQGKITNPSYGRLFPNVTLVNDCANQCASVNVTNCISFGYSASAQTCRFFKQTLTSMMFVPGTTKADTLFYDLGCYNEKCKQYCSADAQPIPKNPGGNVIRNPSFERGQQYWYGDSDNFFTKCNNGSYPYNGLGFVRLKSGDIIRNIFKTTSNSIHVQLFYRVSTSPSGSQLGIIFITNDGAMFNNSIPSASSSVYQLFETDITYKSPGSNYLAISTTGNNIDYSIDLDYITAFNN